ncbi:hypothetical protein RND81_10G172400 [Saponaria officinalis]|uniref:Sulfotransferase n=1 Tax=Saponaria officinalis TaxID=3572 RepID=A0AAW1I5M6_SAPOF
MSMMKKLVKDFEFCEGMFLFGPYFENVLEYWNTSVNQPEKVLFLKYEQLKANPTLQVKRLAEFIGMPFSAQEENGGVVDDIIELCSFKNIKELEVNKSGSLLNFKFVDKMSLFRKEKWEIGLIILVLLLSVNYMVL